MRNIMNKNLNEKKKQGVAEGDYPDDPFREIHSQGQQAGIAGKPNNNPYGEPGDSKEASYWDDGYELGLQIRRKRTGVAEGKKPDNYHIVNKDGKPASLSSYADRASAVKDRDAKHPDAEVRQVGPRGKVKSVSEGQLEFNTPDPVVVVQDLKGNILDKINLSVAAQKYKLGAAQNIKNQLAHQNYTTIGNYVIVSPMSGQPQDATTQGMAEMDNRTPSGDREEQRKNSPEQLATQHKEQQQRLKDTSPEMRKKLGLPEPKQGVAEGSGDDFYAMALQKYPQLKRVNRETVINALNGAYEDYLMHYGYEGIGPDEEISLIDYAVKRLKQGVAEGFNGEYDDEAGMASGSLHTLKRAVDGLMSTIDENDNLPEWCQEKISLAEDYLVTVWDYIQSEKEQGVEPKINEHKKGVKAMKYTKKAKPVNPVAKNAMAAIGGGAAGEHDNKKKKVDRKAKHKKKELELAETNWYELRLQTMLESKIKK